MDTVVKDTVLAFSNEETGGDRLYLVASDSSRTIRNSTLWGKCNEQQAHNGFNRRFVLTGFFRDMIKSHPRYPSPVAVSVALNASGNVLDVNIIK